MIDDDTVIGEVFNDCYNLDIRLSDLDEPHQEAIREKELFGTAIYSSRKRIAELEARLAKAEAALEAADILNRGLSACATVEWLKEAQHHFTLKREAMK